MSILSQKTRKNNQNPPNPSRKERYHVEIIIKGEPKEIADLLQQIQSQQKEKLLLHITETIPKTPKWGFFK